MARRGILGGLLTVTTAAAAVAGVCYLFKDEIKGTKTYQDLDEKYDVDKKIKEYSEKAKTTAYELKDKAKTAFGIGTFIANDTKVEPLNIVMKTTACNGMDVAKLSDIEGKGMCKNPDYIHYLKRCIDWRMKHETMTLR